MSNSRDSSPDTIDIEIDPVSLEIDSASRNVRQRRSPSSDNFHIGEPSHAAEHSDSSSEPFEDEEIPLFVHLRSPSPLPPTSLPSPLPPVSPRSPVAGPSSLPDPSTPIAPSSPVFPSLRFSSRNEGTPIRWDWMPISIRTWREAEQIPVIPLPPELHTPPLTLTGEPVHDSIPVMIARLRTHDEQLWDIETALQGPAHEVEVLQHQVAGLQSEISEIQDAEVDTNTRGIETRNEVTILRQETVALRQETTDLRQEVTTLRQELAELREHRDQSRADAPSS